MLMRGGLEGKFGVPTEKENSPVFAKVFNKENFRKYRDARNPGFLGSSPRLDGEWRRLAQ